MNVYSPLDRAIDAGLWNAAFQLIDPRIVTPLDTVGTLGVEVHVALRDGEFDDLL